MSAMVAVLAHRNCGHILQIAPTDSDREYLERWLALLRTPGRWEIRDIPQLDAVKRWLTHCDECLPPVHVPRLRLVQS
jgi:hypothetical protein